MVESSQSTDLNGAHIKHGMPAHGGFCLCSMVLRPVERLVFSPKER